MTNPSNLTVEELLNYPENSQEYIEALSKSVYALIDELEVFRKEEASLLKRIEVLEEEVYFRNEFISELLQACKRTTICKELINFIRTTLENSDIEF